MRTLIVAASTAAALLGAPLFATAQENQQQNQIGEPGVISGDPIGRIGSVSAAGEAGATSRVYVLPPELDVETTGSLGRRNCFGETLGSLTCQDSLSESQKD